MIGTTERAVAGFARCDAGDFTALGGDPHLFLRARRAELQALEQQLVRIRPACPVCDSPVEHDYLACPTCTTMLREPCNTCGAPLKPSWQICPYCASSTKPAQVDLDAALTAEMQTMRVAETA